MRILGKRSPADEHEAPTLTLRQALVVSSNRAAARLLQQVGIGTTQHLAKQLGITTPDDLLGRDPYAMYDDLCRITGQRHDPCLFDTFIAAVRYMEGAPKKPWSKYTAERKREMAARESAK